MTILRFPCPAEPLSVNREAAKPRSRQGAMRLYRIHATWRDTTTMMARSKLRGTKLGPSTVQVTIPFSTNRRRDPHNYTGTVVKWIIDGLVLAGVWPDDTAEYVTVQDPVLVVGDEVVVSIQPRRVRPNP